MAGTRKGRGSRSCRIMAAIARSRGVKLVIGGAESPGLLVTALAWYSYALMAIAAVGGRTSVGTLNRWNSVAEKTYLPFSESTPALKGFRTLTFLEVNPEEPANHRKSSVNQSCK